MMPRIEPDQEAINTVRGYVQRQLSKPDGEKIAFNEGVMAASFALGGFIDSARSLPDSGLAVKIMEAAYESMTRARVPSRLIGSAA